MSKRSKPNSDYAPYSATEFADIDDGPCFSLKEEIRQGNHKAVKKELKRGVDPNDFDPDYEADEIPSPPPPSRYTLLHWAVRHMDIEYLQHERLPIRLDSRVSIVRLLLQNGAKVNTIWWKSSASVVPSPMTPMDLTENHKVLRLLIPYSLQQALAAADRGPPTGTGDFVRDFYQSELDIGILSAAHLGQTDACRILHRAGANMNSSLFGKTPSIMACSIGHLETVKCLIEELGANVDFAVDNGRTALMLATCNLHLPIVEFLLERGANPLLQSPFFEGIVPRLDTSKEIGTLLCTSSVQMLLQEYPTLREAADPNTQIEMADEQIEIADEVFLSCIQHDHRNGVLQLCRNPNFLIPPFALRAAVQFGRFEILCHVLKSGAMTTWKDEEECTKNVYPIVNTGSHLLPNVTGDVKRCQVHFRAWKHELIDKGTMEHGSLVRACCLAIHKAGVDNFDIDAFPPAVRDWIDLHCPDPNPGSFEVTSNEMENGRRDRAYHRFVLDNLTR